MYKLWLSTQPTFFSSLHRTGEKKPTTEFLKKNSLVSRTHESKKETAHRAKSVLMPKTNALD